jgi:hypothetical protein
VSAPSEAGSFGARRSSSESAIGDTPDVLDVIHVDLLARARGIVDSSFPATTVGAEDRAFQRLETALLDLSVLLRDDCNGQVTVEACLEAAESDERLAFVNNLPASAAFGGALGSALEGALYGSTSAEVRQLTALLNIFVTLLDGLVDEAPELLERDVELFNLLHQPELAYVNDRLDASSGDHPVTDLLRSVLRSWVSRSQEGQGWIGNRAVRAAYGDAVVAALNAEFRSQREQLISSVPVEIDAMRALLGNKATTAIWVIALAPMTLRGFPSSLDQRSYSAAMKSCGAYFGWIDDVRDVRRDLNARRWNHVLLDIWDRVGRPPVDAVDFQWTLLAALAFDDNAAHVLISGERMLRRALENLERLHAKDSELRTLIADASREWLEV